MKKNICKLLSLVLALALALSLGACGGGSSGGIGSSGGNSAVKTPDGKLVWYLGGEKIFGNSEKAQSYFEGIADSIDPAAIYSATEITEDMLCGAYILNNRDKDLKTVRSEIPFADVAFPSGTTNVSILPTAVYLGAEYICTSETNYNYGAFEEMEDHAVAVLELATQDNYGQLPCTYEISGNTITFKHIRQTSGEDEPLSYEFTGVEFSYTFSLAGPYLTFTKDGSSLKLIAYCMSENTDDALSITGYSLPDSPLIGGLDYFASAEAWNYAVDRTGSYFDVCAYKLDQDGRFTIYLAEEDLSGNELSKFTGQYAYIIQSDASSFLTDFSVILLDGSKVYYYTDTISQREARALKDQGVDISDMTEDAIKEIAEKKEDLFNDLQAEFEAQGINVTINRSTGEIALDSTVLFGVSESAISDEGKTFLQKFMKVYTSVVLGEKYKDFVSKIMVEGHTDTSGSYEMNQELSQARADSVKAYCLSAECGMDAAHADALQTMLEAAGYSYDKPVYDTNGEVDMDASRRVSFRFLVNVEQ